MSLRCPGAMFHYDQGSVIFLRRRVVRANKNVLFCLSLILSGSSCQFLQGQASSTTADGIYSADQAHRGEALYKKQCLSCHGKHLTERVRIPRLAEMISSPNTRVSPQAIFTT